MKTLGIIFCCLVFAIAVFALSGPPQAVHRGSANGGALDTRWGPDAYGYRARDNNETDGPTYAWMDISTTGTLITGLVDDNMVGPFPIGFTFQYYWYDVSQFWVGSNGYIQFQPGGTLASPFPPFPTDTLPNNVIGAYIGDWILGGSEPGHCYYQTFGTDSLIVMWQSVRAWQPTPPGPAGNHNFELILSRLDSSFTIQFGTLTSGDLYTTDIAVGMENVTGTVGIPIYTDAYPPANTAIKFYFPDTVTYVAHDIGIAGVQNATNSGVFLLTGDTLHPDLMVRNVGNQVETGFHSIYSVRSLPSNTLLTSADSLCGSLDPAQILSIAYPTTWIGGATGAYRLTGRVNLTGDLNHNNDSVRVQLHTLTLPGELYYDDNSAEQGWGWAGGTGGMGNQFVPPAYPVRITQLRFYIFATGTGFTAQIWSDSAGMPGSVLWSTDITSPPGSAWAVVPVPALVRIDSGAFYVAWMQQTEGITFGVDNTATQGSSRRAWEYTGSWSEYRLGQNSNAMIRCTIATSQPNRPPTITDHQPAALDTAIQNTTHQFSVTATDPDNDSLRYRWTRNGSLVGTQATANILFPTLGAVVIRCVVSDGQLSDSVSWNVVVVVPDAAGNQHASVPDKFALRAAYPNPFNPSTSLSYDLARDGEVTLKIYDLLGNEVTTLLNGRLAAGRYSVQWNAASQPSGTYFAVLKAGDVRLMQKLLLMK